MIMEKKTNWFRILYITGVVAFLIGTLDPMEGSLLIAPASALIAFAAYRTLDKHWKLFFASMLLIVFGVSYLFYISSLGGFGGPDGRSWWWGVPILPYPIGWLMIVVLLITRGIRKHRLPVVA